MDQALAAYVSGSGPPLLLIHGFLGSARTWKHVLPALERENRCIALDLPGHGDTPAWADTDSYDINPILDAILATLDSLEVEQCALLGYSMGGRIALHFALRFPARAGLLILESTNPGIDDPLERTTRLDADERLARLIETDGMRAFVDYWEDLPLFQSQKDVSEASRAEVRSDRLATSPVAAAAFLRALSPGAMDSAWDRLANLTIPTLVVAGAEDWKYVAIAERVAGGIGNCATVIPASGHAVHLEQPELFAERVIGFLRAAARDRN